jgi:hypothetical protein
MFECGARAKASPRLSLAQRGTRSASLGIMPKKGFATKMYSSSASQTSMPRQICYSDKYNDDQFEYR